MSTKKQSPAVYMILNLHNNTYYIGSSKDANNRITEHKRLLRRCQHPNWKLQMEWDAFGADVFQFDLLERIADGDEYRFQRETMWCNLLREQGFTLYNICPNGVDRTDTKLHPIQIKQRSKRQKGKKHNMSEMGLIAIQKATSYPRPDVSERFAKDWPNLVGPDGIIYENIHNLLQFSKEHNCNMSALRKVCIGKRPSHHGFRLVSHK